ncbi:MAG: tRNA (adenosine(37)-N6)-threonylcarbamoyltransferase complex ATPase subunit type 1 TsaE [Bacteroidales bacterium]
MSHLKHYNLYQLEEVALWLIEIIDHYKVVALYGQMGVGKTTLIKEICTQLQVINNVTSPTFSLVNEYHTHTQNKIYHFDFYRIKNLAEAYDLGCEEYFDSNALCLIEWPELAEELLPQNTIKLKITIKNPQSRTIEIL